MIGYDPVKLSQEIERIVAKGKLRKYYRFRGTRFYGGIATADCVGCNLSCYYCWSDKPRKRPGEIGRFYSPKEVVDKIIAIMGKRDFSQARISGNEPTIAREHLIATLKEFTRRSNARFILETNGILLGHDESYAYEVANLKQVHVRVSLKGCSPEQFFKLTGAKPEAFELQLKALENLVNAWGSCHAAVMGEFASGRDLIALEERLAAIDPSLKRDLEFEHLMLFPHVRRQLTKHGIKINSRPL